DFWSWRSSSRAASSAASESARIIRCTMPSRSPRNMCSVRHRPIPSAPKERARAESSGVSALVRTRRRRNWSAYPRTLAKCPAGDHAVEVVGARLGADEDDLLPRLGVLLGVVGGEVHRTDGGAGRGVEALGDGLEGRLGVELGVEQLVELGGLDPQDGLLRLD